MKHRDVIMRSGLLARVVRNRVPPMRKSRRQELWNSGTFKSWN